MQAGAEVDLKNDDGWTPLNNAAEGGHIECVDRLLRVCATCSCFALPFVPSAHQVSLFFLIVGFGSCE